MLPQRIIFPLSRHVLQHSVWLQHRVSPVMVLTHDPEDSLSSWHPLMAPSQHIDRTTATFCRASFPCASAIALLNALASDSLQKLALRHAKFEIRVSRADILLRGVLCRAVYNVLLP